MSTREHEGRQFNDPDGLAPREWFAIDVVTTATRFVVLVAGELDLATVPELRETLAAADGRDVDIDLSALEFIDACGLGTLVRAAAQCRRHGNRFRVRHPRPFVQRVMTLCALDPLIESPDDSHR